MSVNILIVTANFNYVNDCGLEKFVNIFFLSLMKILL